MAHEGESSRKAEKKAKKQLEAAIAAANRDSNASLRIREENFDQSQENVVAFSAKGKGKSKLVADGEDVCKHGKIGKKKDANVAAVSRTLKSSFKITEENNDLPQDKVNRKGKSKAVGEGVYVGKARNISKKKLHSDIAAVRRTLNSSSSDENSDESIPCSEENVNDSSSKCRPNRRGKSMALDDRKDIGPHEVSFNHRGQPVGRYAAKFASFLGVTARNLVPLTISDWRILSTDFKNQLWEHVIEHYVVDKCYKKQILRRLACRWTDHKSRTVTKFKKEARKKGFDIAASSTLPKNVHSLDAWKKFLKSKMTPRALERTKYFRKLRSKKTLLHKTSRKSFAQIEYEMKENSLDPDSIGRSDVWLEAYGSKNKDGIEDVEDIEEAEIVQKVKKMKLNEASSSVMDDAVSQVLGPERRGRVRGLGFGALPSKVDGQAHASSNNSKLEREVHELKLSVQKILAKLELKDEYNGNDDIRSSSGDHSNNKNKNASARSVNNASVCGKKRKEPGSKAVGNHQEASQVPSMTNVHLLSWLDAEKKVVATADIHSKDPKEMIHCVPIGHGMWKVWVRKVYHDIPLIRPTSEFGMLSKAIGSTVAWPVIYIEEL